jgi:hypothetical protein
MTTLANLSLADLVGMIVGLTLTIMIFSYVVGDNALFRIAISIFIGVASGYAAVVAWYNVIWPQLIIPAAYGTQSERIYVIFPLVMSALILFKISPRLSPLGNPAIAYLLGVGMAAAIAGAIFGTILPQSLASMNLFDTGLVPPDGDVILQLMKGSTILLGVFTTLIYFHFGVRQRASQPASRPRWLAGLAWVGQIFIAITLGALFAGVYSAALTALIERVHFIKDFIYALVAA